LFARFGRLSGARRAEELLERFGLAARRRSVFSALSGGERQRLFLVLALLNEPRLVILDELTQGLDPAARREVWRAVAQLRDGGTTVLLVTHELAEAEALCERLIVMRSGRVLDSGSPAELVGRHARCATVRFTVTGPEPPGVIAAQLRDVDHVVAVGSELVADGTRCVVEGERAAIAHVGAWLVQRGDVPSDLDVSIPGLGDALLALLEHPEPKVAAAADVMFGARTGSEK